MINQELERARSTLKQTGADFALLSSCENVTYVSHWEVPVDFGGLATQNYGPTLALFGVNDKGSALLAGGGYVGWAKGACALDEVIGHDVFSMSDPVDAKANFL